MNSYSYVYKLKRTRTERWRRCTELEWRQNVLSGYVREPSGVLTLTALSCSYHTVSHTALRMDLSPMNGAISLYTELREIKVHSNNPVWLRNYLEDSSFRSFLPPRFIYLFSLKKDNLGSM